MVLVVRSLARNFCFSCGGHGVTTEWNIYTKTSFKRRKSRTARSTLRELKPFSFTSFASSVDVNVLQHVDRRAKLSERVAVFMENGRHFGFFSGCAAQDVRATIRRDPLDLSIRSFLTFLHYGLEEVERHLLWRFHNKIQRKSWSNEPPKLLACIRFLYKVVHKIGHLRKFNCAREIECTFFTAWIMFMKFGTLVNHVHGSKTVSQTFNFCLWT